MGSVMVLLERAQLSFYWLSLSVVTIPLYIVFVMKSYTRCN